MTERRSVPLCFERRGSGTSTWETRCKTLAIIQTSSHSQRGTTLTKATQKSAARPNRELRDQAERRKIITEYGPC